MREITIAVLMTVTAVLGQRQAEQPCDDKTEIQIMADDNHHELAEALIAPLTNAGCANAVVNSPSPGTEKVDNIRYYYEKKDAVARYISSRLQTVLSAHGIQLAMSNMIPWTTRQPPQKKPAPDHIEIWLTSIRDPLAHKKDQRR